MSTSLLVVLIGWLVALAIFFGFIVLLRYLQYREHMAMISTGIHPDSLRAPRHRNRGMLRAGLIVAMVGLTLTIGLYPIGYILPPIYANIPLHLGPWLLPGLIPLGVGIALITSYYLERESSPADVAKIERPAMVKDAFEDHDPE
jgi:formate hydrogenlyase subunit 3/multisubunit Na+/H+ antiporter MnhD subunit